jgi:hypothetical protein
MVAYAALEAAAESAARSDPGHWTPSERPPIGQAAAIDASTAGLVFATRTAHGDCFLRFENVRTQLTNLASIDEPYKSFS